MLAGLLIPVMPAARAAQTLPSDIRTAGREMHRAFEPVREVLQHSSAVIGQGRRARDEVIYGTVVSPDGFILTKASELEEVGELTVVIDRESYESVRLVAEDPAWDLALLKVEAEGLIPVVLSEDGAVSQGTWVVANGSTSTRRRRVQVGVVSANERPVFPKGGAVLGVRLDENEDGLVVSEVTEEGGAERAGVQAGDRLLEFAGQSIKELEELVESLEKRQVGEVAEVVVERDGERLELQVELSGRTDLFGEETTRNDAMSGEFSSRRSGFPMVMQHDIMGNYKTMGGPLLDLDGTCLGMNIARASRCETYAIPASELRGLIPRLIEEARE